ncbi:MAG: rane protein, partial [Bryobacterales bacterium]|nr:rane protein [Bryobacterales bacterium]
MILNALTIFHVVLSLIGIGSGVVAIYRLLKAKTPGRWTQTFLAMTAATSLTGFLFPFQGLTP